MGKAVGNSFENDLASCCRATSFGNQRLIQAGNQLNREGEVVASLSNHHRLELRSVMMLAEADISALGHMEQRRDLGHNPEGTQDALARSRLAAWRQFEGACPGEVFPVDSQVDRARDPLASDSVVIWALKDPFGPETVDLAERRMRQNHPLGECWLAKIATYSLA